MARWARERMRKLVAQQFVTLDGFAAGPKGELDSVEESSDADPTGGDLVDDQLAFIGTLDTILLGAETYRMFGVLAGADRRDTGHRPALNATPKVVFSRTLDRAPWGDWDGARIVGAARERGPPAAGGAREGHGRVGEPHALGVARARRPGGRVPALRLPGGARPGQAALRRRHADAPARAGGHEVVRRVVAVRYEVA